MEIPGEHYCQPNWADFDEYPWTRCNETCYDDNNEPREFEQDKPESCGTQHMECQFPFIYNGKTYDSCTNSIILEYPYGSFKGEDYDDFDDRTGESFSWCATEVLASGEMQEGKWGICDPETCDISAPDYEF